MARVFSLAFVLAPALGQAAGAAPADKPPEARLEQLPKDLEMRFALSALPPHLRDEATVYVLDPAKGYTLGRQGKNALTCIVERTEWAKEDFRNDIYTPLCYDKEGAQQHLRVYMDVAQLRAQGSSPQAIKAEIEKRFKSGTYRAPTRAGLSYMVAPLMRGYISTDPAEKNVSTFSMPHVMYYAPNLTDDDIGGGSGSMSYPFIIDQGPHGYMIQALGKQERDNIVTESQALLKDLCAYKPVLCLKPSTSPHSHH